LWGEGVCGLKTVLLTNSFESRNDCYDNYTHTFSLPYNTKIRSRCLARRIALTQYLLMTGDHSNRNGPGDNKQYRNHTILGIEVYLVTVPKNALSSYFKILAIKPDRSFSVELTGITLTSKIHLEISEVLHGSFCLRISKETTSRKFSKPSGFWKL